MGEKYSRLNIDLRDAFYLVTWGDTSDLEFYTLDTVGTNPCGLR